MKVLLFLISLTTCILLLSCNQKHSNFQGFWCTDIKKTDPILYSELFFTKDSVVVSTPYTGTDIFDYKITNDSMMKIGSNTYRFRFSGRRSFLINLNYRNVTIEYFTKFKGYKDFSYLQRYVIHKINSDSNRSKKVRDSLIKDIKIGIFPKINMQLEDEIPTDR